jgi:hypothetical protein
VLFDERLALVMDYSRGRAVELDFGFTPAPSGGGLCLYQDEDARNSYAVLHGYIPGDLTAPDRQRAIALITISGVVQSIFGYPNEEAFWKDPRGDMGHGFFEVVDSSWIDEINGYNVATFGAECMFRSAARHFFIGSKDVSAQFLARDLAVEVFTGQTTDWVHGEHTSSWVQGEALRRLSQ